jgi:hypothetical protein
LITKEQLEHWKALADAATLGKWEATQPNTLVGSGVLVEKPNGMHLALTSGSFIEPDAAFIAAAREAVPALIADVTRLQEIEKRGCESIAYWRDVNETAFADEIRMMISVLGYDPGS